MHGRFWPLTRQIWPSDPALSEEAGDSDAQNSPIASVLCHRDHKTNSKSMSFNPWCQDSNSEMRIPIETYLEDGNSKHTSQDQTDAKTTGRSAYINAIAVPRNKTPARPFRSLWSIKLEIREDDHTESLIDLPHGCYGPSLFDFLVGRLNRNQSLSAKFCK
jgi:hypothetical protein